MRCMNEAHKTCSEFAVRVVRNKIKYKKTCERLSPSPSSIRWLIAFFASSHDRQPRKMQFICWRLRKLNEATRVEWNYGNQPVCVVVDFFLLIFKRYFSHDSAFVCIHIFHVEATKQHPRRMNKKKRRAAAERKRQELGRWNWHFHTQHLALLAPTEAEWYSFYWKTSSKWEMHDSIWAASGDDEIPCGRRWWQRKCMNKIREEKIYFESSLLCVWSALMNSHFGSIVCAVWLCERITMPRRGGLSPRKKKRNEMMI